MSGILAHPVMGRQGGERLPGPLWRNASSVTHWTPCLAWRQVVRHGKGLYNPRQQGLLCAPRNHPQYLWQTPARHVGGGLRPSAVSGGCRLNYGACALRKGLKEPR